MSVKNLCELPMSRVKEIMKTDDSIKITSKESVFLVSKATELFLKEIVKKSVKVAENKGKRRLEYDDIREYVIADENLEFLDGLFKKTKVDVVLVNEKEDEDGEKETLTKEQKVAYRFFVKKKDSGSTK